jgi:hypothetical protein
METRLTLISSMSPSPATRAFQRRNLHFTRLDEVIAEVQKRDDAERVGTPQCLGTGSSVKRWPPGKLRGIRV